MRTFAILPLLAFGALLAGCSSNSSTGTGTGAAGGPVGDGSVSHPCTLPGTVQFTQDGTITVPGGDPSWPPLDFLHLPAGFCAHHFGVVIDARQIRVAPGGDVFVASPTTATTGGSPAGGLSAIVVLPDDNADGVADKVLTFLEGLPSTQGLLFHGGSLYYQDQTRIMQLPFKAGDRTPSGTGTAVVDVTYYQSGLHWPKTLDVSDDGHIYVGNGGDQGEACVDPHPFHGGILEIDGSSGGKQIAKGFRNPIAVRCAKGKNQCFALELALDYSAGQGGREKMVPIRQGDDWGYPCCATRNLAYSCVNDQNGNPPSCGGVAAESVGFLIGDTPFGLDFEPGNWTGTWGGRAYVATHGAAGTWTGARVVAVPMDPSTGLPSQSTDASGTDQGMVAFASGWDDGTLSHGRPAAVTFAPDGRLFIANDNNGQIFWIAAM